MRTRARDIAEELKKVVRLAGRDPEALEGELPALSALHRVIAAGDLEEPVRVHFILSRLVPEYLDRLPGGRDCRAIRELLTWEDGSGEIQSLTTRYHKAAGHLVSAAADFGRRQEPRLLLECARRFISLDHDDRLAWPLDADQSPPPAPLAVAADDLYAGIVRVHRSLDYRLLVDHIGDAQEIMILNTWIPELDLLFDAVVEALDRRASVSILLLYPDSQIARLRNQALQGSPQARVRDDRVRPGVRHCLEVLAAIAREVEPDCRQHLRVRLYHSLPSLAIYRVDDRTFVSVFVHGQLAVKSVQIEVHGQDTLMGQLAFRELESLWDIGMEFKDITQWQTELETMAECFSVSL